MPGVKGKSGGARKGAGRKPIVDNAVPKKRHTIYCTFDELSCIKELLKEMRKKESAWKEVTKAKGDTELSKKAVLNTIEVEKVINGTTIGQLLDRVENQKFCASKVDKVDK